MKIDPRCNCTTCTIQKLEYSINQPTPDRVKFESIRIKYINAVDIETHNGIEMTDDQQKLYKMISELDCYSDIDDLLSEIDMLKLYLDFTIKNNRKKESFGMAMKGVPRYKSEDSQRRIYKALDNGKTIFDVKEIK